MYLPDTNIFILGLKGNNKEAEFLFKAISKKELVISVVVVGEFLSKAEGESLKAFTKLIKRFDSLVIDEQTALIAADYRKASLKIKRTQMIDCFLAAQAKLKGLILVTNNKSDFPMKDIKIISPN